MMMRKNTEEKHLSIGALRVDSFVTSLDSKKAETIYGGYSTLTEPITGAPAQ